MARGRGHPVFEERITRDELYLADEVFFTGTAAEVTPVREVGTIAPSVTGGWGPLPSACRLGTSRS